MKPRLSVAVLTLIISSLFAPLFLTSVHASGCLTTCSLEADTKVPLSDAIITVRIDGTSYYTLNRTFSFANDTQHTIEVMNTTIYVPSAGARYVFKQWSLNGIQMSSTPLLTTPNMTANYTLTENGAFVAEFDKQFQLSLSFTDPSGQSINAPSSVTLQSGASSVILSSFSNNWLAATTWSVSDATWENMPGLVSGNPTIDLSQGTMTAVVPLKAYTATVRVVDSSNSPVSDATLTVTLANSTSTTLTTDSQGTVQLGHIPLGPYTVHVVYKNQDMGSYSVDASTTAVNTVKLNLGGGPTSGPVVSAVVLLTIFGVAMFLFLLAIKVRKPPPPPTI